MSKQSKQGSLESVSAVSAQGQTVEAAATTERNEAEVCERAYLRWQERGCPVGSPDEDWFRAERELNGRAALSAAQ